MFSARSRRSTAAQLGIWTGAAMVIALIVLVFSKRLSTPQHCIDAAFDYQPLGTVAHALERTDATFLISTTHTLGPDTSPTNPSSYMNDGLPIEHMNAQVLEVVRGDPQLANTTITITQYSKLVCNKDADLTRLEPNTEYLVLASHISESSSLWRLPLGGEGTYQLDPDSNTVIGHERALSELREPGAWQGSAPGELKSLLQLRELLK